MLLKNALSFFGQSVLQTSKWCVSQIFTEEFQIGNYTVELKNLPLLSIPKWAYLWTPILFECK